MTDCQTDPPECNTQTNKTTTVAHCRIFPIPPRTVSSMLLQIPIEDEDTLCTFAVLMRHPRAALCSLRAPETGELDDWDGRTYSTPKLLNFLGALPKFSQSLLLRSRRDGSPPLLPPLCLDSVEYLKDRLVANACPSDARFRG